MATYGFDTTSVTASLASSAKTKYGTGVFYGRYLTNASSASYTINPTNGVSECRAMWDNGARYLLPICQPGQSHLSGSQSLGASDAAAFCTALLNVYHAVGPLLFPPGNRVHVYLDVEASTNLGQSYWIGWSKYVNSFAVTGHGAPLYSGIYCSPPSATTNCSTLTATNATTTCYSVWSNQPEPCSGCGKRFGTLAWQPKNCTGYTTHLWQLMADNCTATCGGAALPNVDLDMGNPSYTVTDFMMFLNLRP